MKVLDVLLDLLFPPRCPFCDRLLGLEERLLCPRCQAKLPWTREGEREFRVEFAARCVAPLWYQDLVRDSFLRYKFHGRRDQAGAYASLMSQCVLDRLWDEGPELVAYVPLSARRRRARGFDQVELMARVMARELGLPLAPVLRKVRHTPPQSGLRDPARRRANVLGAFAMARGAQVEGRRVLLVDDVVTTGATLGECARILRSSGAADVVCATLARARR